MRKGIGVSPGVGVGTAYLIHEIFINPETRELAQSEVLPELARYEQAREKTAVDLRALQGRVSAQVGPEESAIFKVHESILHDPAFEQKVRYYICEKRQPAPTALHQLMQDYDKIFNKTNDAYLRERLADVRDVVLRLSTHLSEVLQPETNSLPGALVIVANELLPSQVALLGEREIAAIVTQSGGRTSHAAILARSHGIPAITGVHDILRQVRNGDLLVVDGRDGMVVINPDPETEAAYRKVQREFVHLKDALAANRDEPAVSKDGVAVELLANINNLDDLDTAKRMGAAGVGLYRTEYLFLSHPSVPNEQEQLDNYRQVFARAPGNNVAIRTLDLGGDKTVPYMGASREANPFLGWRSIRLSFEHPEFFARQIRAVLRAAADFDDGGIRLMFPMITTLEEMRRVTALVRRVRRRLDGEGVAYGKVEIGMMLEVPAAAVSIDNLLEVVDFVSIGSNDLVQYLMAADRDNPKVSHLCVPLSPPVLKTLRNVIARCNKHGKPVTLCGEMAGIPRAFLLLFGMGLRSYSMSPAFIPTIKDLLKHITVEEAEAILKQVLKLKTFAQVDRYMTAKLAEIAPNLKLLDTA